MTMELEVKGHHVVIVAVYALNEEVNVNWNKNKFDNKLTTLLNYINHRKEVMIRGVFNVWTGGKEIIKL